ncbi:TIGR03663 family protein [candidate division KSB1 bacterium]|nr:TIGR03663 family protein [candidate division KSB1 bacterium]RQW10441.1 MAG: TIGR03663 family protein [candidate division KSB1 bacterium]
MSRKIHRRIRMTGELQPLEKQKMKRLTHLAAFALILLFALALRLPRLAQRPMHTDEAVHAIKFGQLLQEQYYEYDPIEYHGPTLVYSTLVSAWLKGQKTLAEVNEGTLRSIPVFFGIALIIILLCLVKYLNWSIILFAALFTTISPAFVFYSRYYIMEIMLVFFTLAAIIAGYACLQTKKLAWAIAAGAAVGLMHATKETCALAWFAMAAATLLTMRTAGIKLKGSIKRVPWAHVGCALVIAFMISASLFSSFFTQLHGILDSITTYANYFKRGAGQHSAHLYPWFQYFQWLFLNKFSRPLWSEAMILLLAAPGFYAIFSEKQMPRADKRLLWFIAHYTLVLTLIYMVIPYKTPWSMLGFYHGYIIIAAVGATSLCTWTRFKSLRIILSLLLAAGATHLGWQSYQLNFKYDADLSNPYVYAHTDADFFRLLDAIEQITSTWPQGKNTYIEVVCPEGDYWPLPWYLRAYSQVGYFNAFNYDLPAGALIITKPILESDLLKKLYEIPPPGQRYMYIPHFQRGVRLRCGVEMDLYVRKDVWDEWYRQRP